MVVLILDIIKDSIKPYVADSSSKFQTIAEFDCRGVEPLDFEARVRVHKLAKLNFFDRGQIL